MNETTFNTLWFVLLTACPLIGAVVLFAVHVLQMRNLQAQNKKLQEEILKLQAERQDRESVIKIASFDQIERFASPASTLVRNRLLILSLAAVLFVGGYLLQSSFVFQAAKQANDLAAANLASQRAIEQERATVQRLQREADDLRKRLDEEQSELIKRLGTGDVRVLLKWDSRADVDLYVVDPSGETIYFEHPTSRSGGRLDRDDTDGFGPENIFWPPGRAPRGKYRVYVALYSGETSNYTVQVTIGGRVSELRGVIQRAGERKLVTEFEVP